MQNDNKNLYSQSVIDFITVSTEFCKYVEQLEGKDIQNFCQVMRGLLPMIYLKATLLKQIPETDGWNTKKLTEDDYNYVRNSIASILGSQDDFLDTFVDDFQYSETPVLCTISENIADIYQQLRELVEVYRNGYEDAMLVELYEVLDEFHIQWGQKLLNALRAIHNIDTKEFE